LGGGSTFSWFLRLSLHAGRTYAKVTVQKINLTPSSSNPKTPGPARISGHGPVARAMHCWCMYACVGARAVPAARHARVSYQAHQAHGRRPDAMRPRACMPTAPRGGGSRRARRRWAGSHATNQAGMPTAAMVPSCARQPSGRQAGATVKRYVPPEKLNSQRDADIGPTPALAPSAALCWAISTSQNSLKLEFLFISSNREMCGWSLFRSAIVYFIVGNSLLNLVLLNSTHSTVLVVR
jgi:hypothetical protein